MDLFFSDSCQLEVKRPSGSRAVMTTCTSAGASCATIRSACSVEAAQKNSWLTSASPDQPATSARTRSHAPGASGPRRATPGSSRTIIELRRWSLLRAPGSSSPAARSRSRPGQAMAWR